MNLTEINNKLEEISKVLDSVKWDENLKPEDAKKINQTINSIESLTKEEEFGKEQLDDAVAKLEGLTQKAKDGKEQIDINKDSIESINTKTEIIDNVKNKYEKFFKQKEVIDEFIKKYDPNHIIDIKKNEIKDNNNEIDSKIELNRKIKQFKNSGVVKENLCKIDDAEEKDKKSKKALGIVKEIKELESKMNSIKDSEFKKQFEKDIKNKKSNLKEIINKIDCTYDNNMDNLESNLENKKQTYISEKQNYANEIIDELTNKGETDVKEALAGIDKKKPEELRAFLETACLKINEEVIDLKNVNNNLQESIDEITNDEKLEDVDLKNVSSSYTPTTYQPTDAEIEADPDFINSRNSALAPMTRKERIESRKEYLRDKHGIGPDEKGSHPIIWLRAHFGTKKLDNQMENDRENKIKQQVREKLIAKKQNEENNYYDSRMNAQERKDSRRDAWVRSITRSTLDGKEAKQATAYQAVSRQQNGDEGR